MKSEMFPACPVCEEEMASDANAESYCKLCGMSMTAIGKRFCVSCEQKFRLMLIG